MKTNFSLLFYLKKPKNYVSGDVPVYMHITVDGVRSETSAGRKCDSDQWNSYAGRLKGTDNTELRMEIEKIKAKLHNQDKNMEVVFRYLDELIDKKEEPGNRKRIGYNLIINRKILYFGKILRE